MCQMGDKMQICGNTISFPKPKQMIIYLAQLVEVLL